MSGVVIFRLRIATFPTGPLPADREPELVPHRTGKAIERVAERLPDEDNA
jgi:hypothetical protein